MLVRFKDNVAWYGLHFATGEVVDLTDGVILARLLRSGQIQPLKEERAEEVRPLPIIEEEQKLTDDKPGDQSSDGSGDTASVDKRHKAAHPRTVRQKR